MRRGNALTSKLWGGERASRTRSPEDRINNKNRLESQSRDELKVTALKKSGWVKN